MQSRKISLRVVQVAGIGLALMCAGCGDDKPQPRNDKGMGKGLPPAPAISTPNDPAHNLDFTGLRGVLSGRWESKEERGEPGSKEASLDGPPFLEFTGKSIKAGSRVGKYEMKGDLLHITDGDGAVNIYGLEFLSDSEMVLRPEKVEKYSFHAFSNLQGRWRRISLPTAAVPLGTGPVADAKRQVQRIEKKVAKVESLREATLADRDDLVEKLKAIGVKSSADLKGNLRGQRLAENVAKITAEIDGLEKQLVSLDTELLKAKSIVRRMEREQAGLSEEEMRKLSQQLREVEERTDGVSSAPTTPLDVEAALEKAFKATPTPKKTK